MISRHRSLIFVASHAFLFSLSLLLSFGLAYDFRDGRVWFFHQFLPIIPLNIGIKLLVFGLMGQYRASWRYVGLRDWLSVIKATHISTFFFVLGFFLIENLAIRLREEPIFQTFPQSVFALDWVGTAGLVCVARIAFRLYQEELRPVSASAARTLIVGAADAGVTLLREIQRMPDVPFEVVGFVDDDVRRQHTVIHQVPVLGTTDEIKALCDQYDVGDVLIAMPNATQREIRRVIEQCQGANLLFRTIPAMADLIEGKVQVSQIREVSIEDLLGRAPVNLDWELIGGYVRGKVVVVTGAGGSIGSEMCRQVARFNPKRLVLIEQAENNLFEIHRELLRRYEDLRIMPYVADICDRVRIDTIFATERPQAAFHAAAHKHVPMMELNPGEAVKNNILGTKTIADAAVKHGVGKAVMISTDKAVNPTSVMGCTKRVAEMYVQQLSHRSDTQFVTVRFGNVLGSSGSVVPIFREQIAKGGPVTVTHPEMVRYFMTIPEASQLVLQAGAMGRGGEIFVLDMGEPVKIVDLAKDMIVLSGLRPGDDIEIAFTGVRPGEKLFEELSIEGEDISRTAHPKIGVWANKPEDWDRVCQAASRLVEIADVATANEIRAELSAVVPEYTPEQNGREGRKASLAGASTGDSSAGDEAD